MNPETLIGVLLLAVAITGTAGLAIYNAAIPWWRSRAGRAYFSLFGSLVIVVWHFVIEATIGQTSPWVEVGLIGLVLAAILFNIWTALTKQLRGWWERRNAK